MQYETPWNAALLRISRDLPNLSWAADVDRRLSWALLGLAALILFWLLLRLRRRQRRKTAARPHWPEVASLHPAFDDGPASVAPMARPEPEPSIQWDGPAGYGTLSGAGEAYDFEDDGGNDDAITVMEADPLAEASIFIMYGYHDRAAELLRWHLEGAGEAQLKVLELLRDSYLKLKQIDDYADILERLLIATGASEAHREALLEGLRLDPENLQLRVLAINYFGLDVDQINALLGLDPVAPAAAEPEPEAAPLASAAPRTDTPPATVPQPAGQPCLVEGQARLAPLSQTEKLVIRGFLSPSRAAKLYLAMQDHDEAIAALHRAIKHQPGALTHFTELLRIHQLRRRIDDYARTLWHLYAALGQAGQALKERLLGLGFSLGRHPVFEALAQAREPGQIEAIGRRFGYQTTDCLPLRKTLLVEVSGQSGQNGQTPGDDILQEVDSYLEFGQIEQAVAALEQAILADPGAVRLYPPLLELYDRMDDLDRLSELAAGIKRRVQRPPEEVVAMMMSLFQRMKQRREQLAA